MAKSEIEAHSPLILDHFRAEARIARSNFVDGLAPNEYLEKPVARLSSFLSRKFRLSPTLGKQQALLIINELEEEGRITCLRNGRDTIRAMKVIRLDDFSAPKVIRRKKDEPKIVREELPKLSVEAKLWKEVKEKEQAKKQAGARKKDEKAEKKGQENETYGVLMIAKLAQAINSIPELKLNAKHDATGKYDKETGKGDKRDNRGEDCSIYIRSPERRWRLIYDLKSSRADAENFNSKVYLCSDQQNANLKKAIVFHRWRSKLEFIEEILDDLISVGVHNIAFYRNQIVYKTLQKDKITSAPI